MEKKFCTTCNMELTPDNRVRWTIGKGKRSGYRAKCHDCYINYLRKIRSTFKKRCLNYKGYECTECGYSKNIKSLEFHHKNPKEKDVSLSNLVYEKWEIVKTELDKCVVLCVNCHREEHHRLSNLKRGERKFQESFISNFSSKILTGKNVGKDSCKVCDVILTEENKSAKNNHCKRCTRELEVKRKTNNKIKCIEYMGGSCSNCGYDSCITALEFHHPDPSKKTPKFSKCFDSWGFERQKKELENCVMLCSNCHREEHDKEYNSGIDKDNQ